MRTYDSWKTRSPDDDLGDPSMYEKPDPAQEKADYEDERLQREGDDRLEEGKAKAQAVLERAYYDGWEDAKIFYENRPTREALEAILASLNYDGTDVNSLTIGEIRRALP